MCFVNDSDEGEEHYERLSSIIHSIPKHNMIINLGNVKAHLGNDIAKHACHKATNKNGSLLYEHAQECNLIITNVAYEKRGGKIQTYLWDMNKSKSQIDYILINRKWKNLIKDGEAFNSFCSLGSWIIES